MRHRRVAAWALVATGLLALLAEPVAAQTSLNEELIRGLNERLLYVAIPISILVEAILIYTVIRYRADRVDEADPTRENRRLEITWTVATAIILLFVGFAAYQTLGAAVVSGVTPATNPDAQTATVNQTYEGAVGPAADEDDAVQIEVVGSKYFWTYNYDNGSVQGSSTMDEPLYIPKDRPVYLHITSTDWLHAFHVPGLALKQDAFPGQYNTIKTVAYEEGTYQLYCAEYCGVGHSGMLGKVKVVPYEEYQNYLDEKRQGSGGGSGNASSNTTDTSGNASTGGNATSTPTTTATPTSGGNASSNTTDTSGNASSNSTATDANASSNSTANSTS